MTHTTAREAAAVFARILVATALLVGSLYVGITHAGERNPDVGTTQSTDRGLAS